MSGFDAASLLASYESALAHDDGIWRKLEHFSQTLPRYQATSLGATGVREKEAAMVSALLRDADLPLLFAATERAHRENDGQRKRWTDAALICVFGSSVGVELLTDEPNLFLYLVAALEEGQPSSLKKIAIKALRAFASEEEEGRCKRCHWLFGQPVFGSLIASVAASDLAVSQGATDTLVDLLRWSSEPTDARKIMLEVLLDREMRTQEAANKMDDGSASSSKNKKITSMHDIRYATLVSRCAALNDVAFTAAQESGALELVISLSRGDGRDVLLQLAALELLPPLATSDAGAKYIMTSGTLSWLQELAVPPIPPLAPAVLKTIADLLATVSEPVPSNASTEESTRVTVDAETLKHLLTSITRHLNAGKGKDPAIFLGGIAALTTLAKCSDTALETMLADNELCSLWLDMRTGLPTQVKASALHSIARVMGHPPPLPPTPSLPSFDESSEELPSPVQGERKTDDELREKETQQQEQQLAAQQRRSELCQRLWLRLGGCNGCGGGSALEPPTPMLMQIVRQPVTEVQYAAMDILRCAAHHCGGWAIKDLVAYGGFVEFLMHGLGEGAEASAREGAEWRYALVESVMRCKDRDILGTPVINVLSSVLRRGPFGLPSLNIPTLVPQ